MKSNGRKSSLNLVTSISYKIIVIVVGLIVPQLFINNYGSELNGLRTSVKEMFEYIAILEAGIGASALQMLYKPIAKEDEKTANSYMSAVSTYYNKIGFIYFIVLAIMGGIYSFIVPVSGLTYIQVWTYILVSGALTGINFFYVAKIKLVMSAEGDIYIISALSMVTYVISSIIKILLIYLNVDIILIEAMYLLINLVTTFCYYLVAKRKYPWLSFNEKPDYSCTAQKNSVLVHRITSIIFRNIDVLILTFVCSLEIVSVYSMYKMIINMITSILSSVGDSVNFIFGQQFNMEQEYEKPLYRKLIDAYNVYYSAIAMALYTVVYILIIPFLKLYTNGMDINYIYPMIPIFYIIMEFLLVGREAMMRTIEVAGHYRKTQWRAVAESVINLVASIVMVVILNNKWGEIGGLYGALIGTILSLMYRTLDINIYASKRILHRKAWKPISLMIENMLIFAVLARIFKELSLNISNYLQFLIHGCWITIIVLITYCVVLSIINKKEAKYVINFVKKTYCKN